MNSINPSRLKLLDKIDSMIEIVEKGNTRLDEKTPPNSIAMKLGMILHPCREFAREDRLGELALALLAARNIAVSKHTQKSWWRSNLSRWADEVLNTIGEMAAFDQIDNLPTKLQEFIAIIEQADDEDSGVDFNRPMSTRAMFHLGDMIGDVVRRLNEYDEEDAATAVNEITSNFDERLPTEATECLDKYRKNLTKEWKKKDRLQRKRDRENRKSGDIECYLIGEGKIGTFSQSVAMRNLEGKWRVEFSIHNPDDCDYDPGIIFMGPPQAALEFAYNLFVAASEAKAADGDPEDHTLPGHMSDKRRPEAAIKAAEEWIRRLGGR